MGPLLTGDSVTFALSRQSIGARVVVLFSRANVTMANGSWCLFVMNETMMSVSSMIYGDARNRGVGRQSVSINLEEVGSCWG